MALVFPYPLAFLNDQLRSTDVSFSLATNQEMSGSGDGRVWASDLMRPLWTVGISLGMVYMPFAREIDAKVRALGQGRRSFLFADPSYWPTSGVYPGNTVAVNALSSDRTAIRLKNLPAAYRIYPGDRLSIAYGSGLYYFGEFVEGDATVVADPDVQRPVVPGVEPAKSRTTVELAVNPPLPFGVAVDSPVELLRPVIRAVVAPQGYKPYSAVRHNIAGGASLSLLQKVGS